MYQSIGGYKLTNLRLADSKYIQGFGDTKTHIEGFGGYKHMYLRLRKPNTHIEGLGNTNTHIQGFGDKNTPTHGCGIQTFISKDLEMETHISQTWGKQTHVPMAAGYKHIQGVGNRKTIDKCILK